MKMYLSAKFAMLATFKLSILLVVGGDYKVNSSSNFVKIFAILSFTNYFLESKQ